MNKTNHDLSTEWIALSSSPTTPADQDSRRGETHSGTGGNSSDFSC